MRLTSKGQVTIPQRLRQLADLGPRTEVEFDFADGAVLVRKARSRRSSPGKRLVARLRGTATAPGYTRTEAVLKSTRGD